jgi:NADPH:quinone reductase-like Zn-dependent oxidoreductase
MKAPRGGQRRLGADFVVLPASELHAIPINVSFLSAAAVAHSFATAWEALFHRGRLGFAERVVVIGASHPAGLAAVQISRWRSCRVVVVADGHQAPRLRALGADRVVSQSAPNLPDHVTAGLGGHRATLVVDVVGAALRPSQQLLDHEGRLVLAAPNELQLVDTDLLINRQVQIIGSGARFDTVDLRHIFKLLSDGVFIPVIDSIHRFSGAAQAIRKAESAEHLGSVLLVPDDLFQSEEESTRIGEEG